jgi:hypothetical protein
MSFFNTSYSSGNHIVLSQSKSDKDDIDCIILVLCSNQNPGYLWLLIARKTVYID